MLIFTKISELQGYLSQIRAKNKTVGFVPTMGALHEGHVSLIRTSKSTCDYTICSVFVNPTQFDDKSDLDRYPRVPEKDAAILKSSYCDALFMPLVTEMYPGNMQKVTFDFGYLDKVLEGAHRPGHFSGVAQIVKRFFEIVKPDKAFFGSKDYQQVLVVKALVKQMNAPIEIVTCPTRREFDGLAMSSRNALLSLAERRTAGLIPGLMQEANSIAKKNSIAAAKQFVAEKIAKMEVVRLDYFEIANAGTLEILSELRPEVQAVSLIAIFVGKIRLIDNLILD